MAPETNDWYIPPVTAIAEKKMPDSIKNCTYNHMHEGTGMGIDAHNRTVILIQPALTKTYPFSDIREWRYDIPGYETIQTFGNVGFGVALGAAYRTHLNSQEAAKNTGFWIRVKDIDHPEWFVRFPRNDAVAKDLARWFEIFNQNINNDTPVNTRPYQNIDKNAPSQVKKFCTNCGTKIADNNMKFCSECGTAINK